MARPKKQEVDYFPHYCDHGKVLFILENRWGNDGYAVFYKLAEVLSKTTGHCYDCSTVESWEYLVSRMGTSDERVGEILNKLASMGVIDGDLWNEKRIWMQSFVDSIGDAYSRRKVDLPQKPELMHTETPMSGINDCINPQSKVKESKVKEIKVEDGGDVSQSPPPAPTLPEKKSNLTDEEFLQTLKVNPAYKHIDVDAELGKIDAWLISNPGKRQKTRRFIVNWLNRIERPIPINGDTPRNWHGPTIKSRNETTAEDAWKTVLEVIKQHGKAKPVFENQQIESAVKFLWGPIADPMSQEDFDETKKMFFEEFRRVA